MAQLGNFDASTVAPSAPMEPVPTAWYKAMITASEIKNTKSGDGRYLEIELQILEGQYAGRKLWDRLNLWNNSAKAVEIAQRTLSAICHATGKIHVQDSVELHNLPLQVRAVYIEEPGYNPKNEVKGYKPIEGAQPQVAAAPAQPAAQPGPAAQPPAGAPPWARPNAA